MCAWQCVCACVCVWHKTVRTHWSSLEKCLFFFFCPCWNITLTYTLKNSLFPCVLWFSFFLGHAHLTDFNIATIIKDGERATALAGTKPYMGNILLYDCITTLTSSAGAIMEVQLLQANKYSYWQQVQVYYILSTSQLNNVGNSLVLALVGCIP